MAKDLFSGQSGTYALYRPSYPKELFEYILRFVEKRELAWDCATGNGQAAVVLSEYFDKVEATDISEMQLSNASDRHNIRYQVSPAEHTPFADNLFDLITVATAYHWFDWKIFYREASRVGKNNCVVAAWTYYSCLTEDEKVNEIYKHFYNDIIAAYWDPERRHVEQQYRTVDFDFDPLPVEKFQTDLEWSKEQFLGYLSSWSSVQHYIKKHQASPVELILEALNAIWPDEVSKKVSFPIAVKLGRVRK
jgi:hypothetical protein